MKKAMVVFVAIALMLVIGGVTVGKSLYDKYSYSKEEADLEEYFQVSGDRLAILLQDERIPETALLLDGVCYFDFDTVRDYLNDTFYWDGTEQVLLYSDALKTAMARPGEQKYFDGAADSPLSYTACRLEDGILYLAADYVALFTNYEFRVFDLHVQVDTQWGDRLTARIQKDTALRVKGGIKSPVLRSLKAGDTVEILEELETWSKVKTEDSFIGYVENKRLGLYDTVREETPARYTAPEYTRTAVEGKVSLGFHAIGGVGGNDTLAGMAAEGRGMNVIAPTWFSLSDNEGNFRSFGTADYVEQAHGKGLQVWGVWDNFNYRLETGESVSTYEVLSVTSKRQYLAQSMVDTAKSLGLDGINLDFEQISSDTGVHFVQFLRELSILCRREGLVLSADNYVPFQFNSHYRLDVQGQVLDYVLIMGYDEHYRGSGDPGSVASIDYVSGGLDRTLENVPADKVINAIPLYTILWKTEGADVTDEYLTLSNTAEFLARVGVTPVWDEETCQNYAEWTSGSTTYRIWLEDADSIRVKLNVMSAREIAGVGVWRLGYGTEEVWALLEAYVNS